MMKERHVGRGNAAFTEAEVLRIIAQKGQMSAKELADLHGVGKETILRIWRGDTWAHLQVPAHLRMGKEEAKRALEESGERLRKMAEESIVELADLSPEEKLERFLEGQKGESRRVSVVVEGTPEGQAAADKLMRSMGLKKD